MIHNNKDEFLKVLEQTSAQTGFPLALLEKDYYITILLSQINSLSEELIFKGGTCLSKVYFSYYRLSEDLDFSMKLPADEMTRPMRRNTIKPVKDNVQSLAEGLGMNIETAEKAGHKESTQYIYPVYYESVVFGNKRAIKLEIGLRSNPILPIAKQKINHKFLHPFTKEPLFEGGTVNCLALKELVAEKLRAASTRLTIAPRDFYDLGYLVKAGFDFADQELRALFKKKLAEDGLDSDLKKYRFNLGRSEKEIKDMKSRIEAELLDVLTQKEKREFNLQKTLDSLDAVFNDLN